MRSTPRASRFRENSPSTKPGAIQFTVEEAGRVFREWLRGGAVSGVVMERVVY